MLWWKNWILRNFSGVLKCWVSTRSFLLRQWRNARWIMDTWILAASKSSQICIWLIFGRLSSSFGFLTNHYTDTTVRTHWTQITVWPITALQNTQSEFLFNPKMQFSASLLTSFNFPIVVFESAAVINHIIRSQDGYQIYYFFHQIYLFYWVANDN